MAAPIAQDVYDYLEYYCIDNTVISEAWINKRINNAIIPWIEKKTRLSFSSTTKQITEYYSGTGEQILLLNRRPIVSLDDFEIVGSVPPSSNTLGSIEVYAENGILISKSNNQENYIPQIFPKGNLNLKVTYTYGFADFTDPESGEMVDIKEAIICMAAKKVLVQVGARTGGGNIGGQAWNRAFGNRGKYTEMLQMCDQDALSILYEYMSGVVGA